MFDMTVTQTLIFEVLTNRSVGILSTTVESSDV